MNSEITPTHDEFVTKAQNQTFPVLSIETEIFITKNFATILNYDIYNYDISG